MVGIINNSQYPVFGFEHKLLAGNPYYIVILKQSYELKLDGSIKALKEQIPIRLTDVVDENARWDSVLYPSDLIPYKPKPEIILNGIAESTTAKKQWICGVDIKKLKNNINTIEQWSKQIVVTGERYWYRSGSSWELEDITPTTKVLLHYENAYGGHYQLVQTQQSTYKISITNGNLTDNNDIIDINYPPNPSGCGWLPDDATLKALELEQRNEFSKQIQSLQIIKAPQLFEVKDNDNLIVNTLSDPKTHVAVAGFSAYTNFWQTRQQYVADDLDWSEDNTRGGYPADFDMHHWQQAPRDQWLDFEIKGGEILTLTGFLPNDRVSYTLPTSVAYITGDDNEHVIITLDMDIDTLVVNTENRTLEIIWRRILPLSEYNTEVQIAVDGFEISQDIHDMEQS